ncbi:excalibur calcium-binding domain-containing protein [Mycobacterium paraterrae]|uniref:Excalibur calcium-binding domain-containing protein n=1 Tax=Mycobacterium paraterrae TaxID=577492 RepID=A0ABY3VNN5_9MYCO|nr:excalibur calcium-binding domain-containing protein [Mycobacterium paraterrae]UMB70807.1 excalibur calcium-binding domain-containing protein [Mycobacterium paraterrae]
MLRTAFVTASLLVGLGIAAAPTALADPPYRNCSEAHADGRYNIPSTDPAYRSQLDRDQDGLACEPYQGR